MSLRPTIVLRGILAVVLGLGMAFWALAFVGRRWGGEVLILLSVLLMPLGGGFLPPFYGILAGAVATRTRRQVNEPRNRFILGVDHGLARLCP